jgi:drug/metabolite transporter (DMT)-like permease
MRTETKAQLQIHVCVVLWGFTAILGKLISLAALPLVWWRMVIVVSVLGFVPRVWRELRVMPLRRMLSFAGVGALVALHWLTFYGAIKLSNASVGATCIALATIFTAVLEPMLAKPKRTFAASELALGLLVLPGVALVVGGVPSTMRLGIAVGTLSALLVAIFGSLNKRLIDQAHPLTVTALELGAGTLLLTAIAPWLPKVFPQLSGALWQLPSAHDCALLVVLAIACTLLPFVLSLVALRHMSAFSAQLAVNLEPVYSIVLAVFLLGEQRELSTRFYLGVAFILFAVVVHGLKQKSRAQQKV